MEKVKFFFWKVFHPVKLISKHRDIVWYFSNPITKDLYRVALVSKEWKKTNFHWEVKVNVEEEIKNKELKEYLIEKAKEDLRKLRELLNEMNI